jgi:hypothetical protein
LIAVSIIVEPISASTVREVSSESVNVILTMARWAEPEETQPSGRAGHFYRLTRRNASAADLKFLHR